MARDGSANTCNAHLKRSARAPTTFRNRDAGADFSANDGYKLSGSLSRGQKSAITRALNQLEDSRPSASVGGRSYSTGDDGGDDYSPDLPSMRDDDGRMPTRRKGTIREQLERLQHVLPKRDLRTGLMYARRDELALHSKSIKLYGVFASDQGTFMLRAHIFESEQARTHEQWADWLAEHYSKILRDSIIPGMINKTGGTRGIRPCTQ
jgi:hypothetical protein